MITSKGLGQTPKILGLCCLFLYLGLSACGQGSEATDPGPPSTEAVRTESYTGDLAVLQAKGVVRLVRQKWSGFDSLSEEGIGVEQYHILAEEFVAGLGLAVQWVEVDQFSELLPALNDGLADLAPAHITVTDARLRTHRFTTPLSQSGQWLIGKQTADPRLGVPVGSAYIDIAEAEGLSVYKVLEDGPPESIAAAILAGEVDTTLMDAQIARVTLQSYPELTKIAEFAPRPLSWAMRLDSPQLQAALDVFVVERHLMDLAEPGAIDLPDIKAAGSLRVITVSGPHTYFLYKGELMGFDYELLARFAKRHDLRLKVKVVSDREAALQALRNGEGDVIAAAVTDTALRRERGWQFTNPYFFVDELLVAAAEPVPGAPLEVHVNPSTSHFASASQLMGTVISSDTDTDSLLRQVAANEIPATIVDEHLLDVHLASGSRFGEIKLLKQRTGLAWGIREDQAELRKALNQYIADVYRGLNYNLLRAKYFGNERRIARREPHRVSGKTLSPYDDMLRAIAEQNDFDWRLLVAQVYQESEFKPKRTSFAGARGLMQVMPRTARQLGFDPDELFEPQTGIKAGVEYLAWCRQRFSTDLPLSERMWFSLAAYNAGPGHVHDARKLAAELGLNRDLWFDNVELAMLELAKPRYARQAAHGYVRGSEPVKYVREIRERYQAYVEHLATLAQ